MKKYSLWTVALLAVGLFVSSATVSAQEKPAATPPQVGLIDMAHIFKNYDKFKDQTESLTKAAQDAEQKAQDMLAQGKQWQQQIVEMTPGSPEHTKLETQMIELKTRLETFRQVEQREIVRKQAELYKQIYGEVQDAVNRYAKYYKYTLIIRFNRAEVADAGNPQAIIANMNRQVVYHQPQDDITESILNYLNDSYKKSQAAR